MGGVMQFFIQLGTVKGDTSQTWGQGDRHKSELSLENWDAAMTAILIFLISDMKSNVESEDYCFC